MATLPYITAPGNIEKAFNGIKAAATPERITQDFVKTILQIPGGSGAQVTSFLKKLGFANPDGSPSEIYRKFRNPATSKRAAAQALRFGYQPLYVRNEYMHELSEDRLKGLIIEETGQSHDAGPVLLVVSAIKALKKFADFSAPEEGVTTNDSVEASSPVVMSSSYNSLAQEPSELGLNLSYTINLNLPATSDIAVFNAIFKSLKDNLLQRRSND